MTIQQLQTFNPVTTPEGSLDTRLSGPCGTLHLLNESLESMLFARDADFSTILGIVPALWAQNIVIQRPPASIWYKVISTLPADDTTLQSVQGLSYSQGEDTSGLYTGPLPRIANVGNPSSVNTSGNTLFNTGNAPGLEVIKLGSTANAGLTADVTNDGLWTLSVTIAGILHQFLKTQTASPQLELGQANDLAAFLGNLQVVGTAGVGTTPAAGVNLMSWSNADATVPIAAKANSATQSADLFQALSSSGAKLAWIDKLGNLVMFGAGADIQWVNNTGGFIGAIGVVDNGGTMVYNAAASTHNFLSVGNAQTFKITNNGVGIQLGRNNAGDAIDQTSSAIYVKAVNGGLNFQSPSGTTKWALSAYNGGFATMGGGTTISHGLGGTPQEITVLDSIAQAGSATVGAGNNNSSTFQCTIGGGTQGWWSAAIH